MQSIENTILKYLDSFVDENISNNSLITHYEDFNLNWNTVFNCYYVMNNEEIYSVNFSIYKTGYKKISTIKKREKMEKKFSKTLFNDFSIDKNRIDLKWFEKIVIDKYPKSSHFLIRNKQDYYFAYFIFKNQYIKKYKNNYGDHKKGDKTLDATKNIKAYNIFKDNDIFISRYGFSLRSDKWINSPCLVIPVSKEKLKDFKKIYKNIITEAS